ncbi:MAG: TetR/AcrR family transcriptional regulator [Chloroflexota bacterium]
MPRTLDPAAHALRRETFVDSAQRLITTRGYEEMSIADVLADTGASKGAFYHYFDSKAALLDAVIERMVDQATVVMESVVADPAQPALDKLRRLYGTMAEWKWERSDLVLQLLRVWQADENAIVREKFRRHAGAVMTRLFGGIVEQGAAEGVFDAPQPAHAARILVALLLSASETATDLFLACHAGEVTFDEVVATLRAYPEACERLLGLPAGTFPFIDIEILRAWFD